MRQVLEFVLLFGVALFIMLQCVNYWLATSLYSASDWAVATLAWVSRNKWLLGVIAFLLAGVALW